MAEEIIIAAGKFHITNEKIHLKCIGLGSCVALAIYDSLMQFGGLAHAMLPRYLDGIDKSNPGKYVDTSIYLMVDELIEKGARKRGLRAKIVGGAQMFTFLSPDTLDIGRQNIETAKQVLKNERIPIVKMDLGGNKGRTVVFNPSTGTLTVQMSGKKPLMM